MTLEVSLLSLFLVDLLLSDLLISRQLHELRNKYIQPDDLLLHMYTGLRINGVNTPLLFLSLTTILYFMHFSPYHLAPSLK